MSGDDKAVGKSASVVPAPSASPYTGPREQTDLGHDEVDAHNLLSDGVGAITATDVPDVLAERWGHGALPGFRNYVAAATAALDWAGENAEELSESFDALPETIQLAIADQLAIAPPSKTQLQPAQDTYVSEFVSTDFGSYCHEVWGRRTPYNLARVDKRIDFILSNLSAEDQQTLLSWFDSIHPQDAAAVYLALAGTK